MAATIMRNGRWVEVNTGVQARIEAVQERENERQCALREAERQLANVRRYMREDVFCPFSTRWLERAADSLIAKINKLKK